MAKKNLHERLIHREIKTPNKLITKTVIRIFKHLAKKRGVRYEYGFDLKEMLGKQLILLSQHCSRDEYIYTIAGFPKLDMHCVVGYQNFFQKGAYGILLRTGTIAKYLYQPDLAATRHMLRTVQAGESLLLFPEGIQSTSGSTHPINPATVRFLMKCGLPVVLCTSHGSYLTRPRYSAIKRKGQMTFSYKLLFSEDDIRTKSEAELYELMLSAFRYNEFEYNREAKIPFKGSCENIDGLDNIIYKCPECGGEFDLHVEGDRIKCGSCGYTVRMDEYYALHAVGGTQHFRDIDEWYKWQRKKVAEEVRGKDFSIVSDVLAYDINLNRLKNKPDLVGEGVLTINDHLITYKGAYNGEDVTLEFDIKALPSLSFSPLDHSVDMYYHNKYYCFAPRQNKLQVVKWMLATEEIHNMYDERWAKVSKDVYEN